MRILLANDGFGDAGGVQTYLDAVAAGLIARGHELAILHRDLDPAPFADGPTETLPQFSTASGGIGAAFDRVSAWAPDVCFSHNMNVLDIDCGLVDRWPTVKFMHGYLGTCIGGQKRFGFPTASPCDRRFGPWCLALYAPRHCFQLNLSSLVGQYEWARRQQQLFSRYARLIVASDHMRREYINNGVRPESVEVNPLFPAARAAIGRAAAVRDRIAFVGRMTPLKGGDVLIDAVREASDTLKRPIELLMIGDGPARTTWERLADAREVACTWTGWLKGDDRWRTLATAVAIAVPSTWPEPFGLVGLEAAALGIPAIAFDVGGIRQWLRPGVNGYLVPARPPQASAFAAALVAALSAGDDLQEMGRRAREIASEMSLARHLDRLEASLHHAHSAGR